MELKNQLKRINGGVICIENSERKGYESREETLQAYNDYYNVTAVRVKDDAVVLEVEDQKPKIDREKEKFIRKNVKSVGRNRICLIEHHMSKKD